MYRVLVADDDSNVRKGLKLLVPWEKYGFEIADSAADGREALNKYKAQPFDLIIVDIQMPRMDGLELISTLRKMDPFVHFLVLSGHADFEYAKKSIDWRVDGYILKPVDEDELSEYLRKIGSMLKKEREERLFTVGENIWRCEMLLQSLLAGDTAESPEEIHEKAAQIGLSWSSYQILLIEPEHHEEINQTSQVNIRRRLKQTFNNNARGVIFRRESYHGILLNNSITKEEALEKLYAELDRIMAEDGVSFFAAIGEPVKNITDIAKSYETAAKLIKNRFAAGRSRIISTACDLPDGGQSRKDAPTGFDIASAAGKLYYAMDVGNVEAVRQLVNEWEKSMLRYGCSEKTIKTNFMQIISSALNNFAYSSKMSQARVQEILIGLSGIYTQPDYISLQNFILSRLSGIICCMENDNNEALVKKLIDIADRHYSGKLTLEMLSETFNYGSGYLGRLFKKYTGESFNTYLDRVRILKAKELLLQGMKVYQVASRTGFSTVDYFHLKFRKYTGISPSQFRKDSHIDSI